MAATIPGYLTAQQAADRLGLSIKTVYNLNGRHGDFPTPLYVGRTPLWPIDQLDVWRERHPARGRP
ncbi:helix-turn-helix transcriptional regulator [Streptomyces sp. NPDC002185]|uniref:helix-turn-helix transcriptional regulator n=1 Tax=Streptomyces sp. NPDC002185 TaxID=3364636 RepID=UPI003683EBD2